MLYNRFLSRFPSTDHKWGILGFLPSLLFNYGWNPAIKAYDWFGEVIRIKSKKDNPDMTFLELFKEQNVELCVVVTNLNQSRAELCHVKTTPEMPIRQALRMTMSMPFVFQAWSFKLNDLSDKDVYVDGGVLNNYPIRCFDGWALSLNPEDRFSKRLRPFRRIEKILETRFNGKNPKTMGCLLYEDSDRESKKFCLEKRVGANEPKFPSRSTKLFKTSQRFKKNHIEEGMHYDKCVKALDLFSHVLEKHHEPQKEGQSYITRSELRATLEDKEFTQEQAELLFGENPNIDILMDAIDKNHDGDISFYEFISYMEKRGIHIRKAVYGYGRREINGLTDFLGALVETVCINAKNMLLDKEDEHRTVGINTGHVGTLNFDLEKEDVEFIIQRGYNATRAFLQYFVVKNTELVTRKADREANNLTSNI